MAVPSTIARILPPGIHLDDGFSTLIAFEDDTNIDFWEKTVQPPGFDGGDEIDITTMHNITYRTFAPRSLVTLTEMSTTVAYDPDAWNQILSIINVVMSITVTFPDASTMDFFGFLKTFEPQDMEEGAQPEANITVQPTNRDDINRVEAAMVLTSVVNT